MLGLRLKTIKTALLCLFLPFVMMAEPSRSNDHKQVHADHANGGYEASLLSVVGAIEAQDLVTALRLVDQHLAKYPKSREGHFMRADILQAQSAPLTQIGNHELIKSDRLKGFKHQMQNRIKHSGIDAEKKHGYFPASLIAIGQHEHIIVADLTDGRLYLYRNNDGQPELLRDYYMSIGSQGYGKEVEGDNRTPVGVYEINRYIEGKALPDLYGKGAFPVNYPNRYDRYLKRTGYGIWLHGTPSTTYARSPWSSEGCFVLSNDDLLDIGQYISVKDRTPVILTDSIDWLTAEQLQTNREMYFNVIEAWKRDWENLDVEAYLNHYSSNDFNFGAGDFKSWAQRKRSINDNKTFIQLDLSFDSLFVYPGREDMFVVKYRQRYLSNNYAGETDKEQYWKRNAEGKWQIIYEG